MVFNSQPFAYFFAYVFVLYQLIGLSQYIPKTSRYNILASFNLGIFKDAHQWQNLLLLIASYYFYGQWSQNFLIAIAAVSSISFLSSYFIDKTENLTHRKIAVWIACLLLGGSLAYMKYFNFFIDTTRDVGTFLGMKWDLQNIKLIVIIGLSYYIFTSIGYVVDVYRRKIKAELNPITYFAYVSFFPHVLSGPIAQATHLLPQFNQKRVFDLRKIEDGIMQFAWGMFKKVVIADSLVKSISYLFFTYNDQPGSVLLLGAIMYSFQVYADFSGYSDMACGLARVLGFEVIQNFKLPFFSRDIGEFWRRWHISLSKWLTSYFYVPLGGKSPKRHIYIRNILLTFSFSGLWHGANWTYITWGFLNGLYFVPYILSGSMRKYDDVVAHNHFLPNVKELGQMLLTFTLVCFSRVFFRSPDMMSAFGYFKNMFSWSLFTFPDFGLVNMAWIGGLVIFEWMNREKRYPLSNEGKYGWLRYPAMVAIVGLIYYSMRENPSTEYLYFKF
jgi:alginate O-acetyltransferase complex protein AlgI